MPDTRPGKVIRLKTELIRLINNHRAKGESWSTVIERLIGKPNMSMWTLPSKLYSTKSEAKGVAVQEAAMAGKSLEEIEQPIKVMEKIG